MSTDQAYQGRAGSNVSANIYAALDFLVSQKLAQISTATYVQVDKAPYDANGNVIAPGSASPIGFVDVLPLVNQLDGYDQSTPHAVVYRLSYIRYQGGNGAFISDPVKGDIGKMIVSDRDTSVVRATGAQANPGSRRKFDKADGTYIGSVIAGAPTQYFAWLPEGFNLVDAYGNTIKGTASGVLINGALINMSGDVITKNGVDLDRHIHNQPADSHGDTEAPTTAPVV